MVLTIINFIVAILGKNEENLFDGFSQKGPNRNFNERWILAAKMYVKRTHKPLFLGVFKKCDFFSQTVTIKVKNDKLSDLGGRSF